ncbi:hypothetical protein Gpo141_00009977 [Globisporangium polare]
MPLLSHVGTTDANKSRVEIAAANNLHKLYDALLADSSATTENEQSQSRIAWSPRRSTVGARPQSARLASKPRGSALGSVTNSPRTSAVDAVRSLRRQRQNRHESSQPMLLSLPAKSPSKFNYVKRAATVKDDSGAMVFVKWISLATTISSLEVNVSDLKRELRASELKCIGLQQQARLAIDSSDPKLQCLEEILGHENFQRYLNDLDSETASFRAQFALYGRRFQWFQQRVWETHDKRVTKATCLDILNRAVSTTTSSGPTSGPQPAELVVLLSQYPVLFQHCLDTQDPERIVLTELLKLLSAIPAGRERLLQHLFEQIADARRGEGAKPPPDIVRTHRLTALAKQSLASGLCSKQEFDEVEKWLDTEAMTRGGESTAGVSLKVFLRFHIEKSDAFRVEDAEFVTYLMRMWSFQISCSGQEERLKNISQVLTSYETRCQLAIAATRKKELVLKVQNALSGHVTKFKSLEAQVQQIQVLQLNSSPVWKSIQNDERLAAQCGSSLTLLKVLTLSSQCLQVVPAFIPSLRQLEVLDLSDNLVSALPLEIEQLQSLQRLALSFNRLTDTSFQGLEVSFSKLSALCDLRLDNNQITSLPRAIPAIPSLTALDVSQNQIKTLPRAVLQLWAVGHDRKCQLVALDLHQNALTSLPEELSVLSLTLRHLILHENKLETLPASLSQMLKLETLTLSHNALDSSGLQAYPAKSDQRHITLDHNQLRQFPAMKYGEKLYLEGTPSQVQSINASWNKLRIIPPGALGSLLPLCEELNLSHNSLQELPEDLFLALPGLRVCKLGSNQLQRLPESILSCTRLQVLDLQQNRLQSLPVELAQQLTSLVVLNAMENQLVEIPSEWHAFASHCDHITGKRYLQTLALKKNPVRSKVLKTIIDGGSVDVSAAVLATTKPNDEQLCEFAVKKIIDALHSTLEVLAMETEGFNGDEDGDVDVEARGVAHAQATRGQWKGMTRNVAKYLEQRLHTIQAAEAQHKKAPRPVSTDRRLLVTERAFGRMLRSLPSTCSEKEMTSLVNQFRSSSSSSSGESGAMVSGYAFLRAIDQFGQHRSLSTAPAVANSSFAISKPGDPVASILHYLSIVHSQQQQQAERLASPRKRNKKDKALKVDYVKKNKLSMETRQCQSAAGGELKASTSQARRKQQQIEEREAQAKNRFLQRHLDPEHEVLMRRQKQRIQILEQQLLDQKLLLLSQQQDQQTAAQATKQTDLGPATGTSDDEASDDQDNEPQAGPKTQDGSSVLVCVKCVKGQEHLPAMQRWKRGPLTFSINMNAPASAVKQQIERETQIPIASQVLISAPPGSGARGGGVPVRVRNDAAVKEYLEILTVESKMKWHLTLLVGESLRVTSLSQ